MLQLKTLQYLVIPPQSVPDAVPPSGAPSTVWATELAVTSLRYSCTKVEVEDQEAAMQMSSTATPLKSAMEDAIPLVE